MNNTNKVELRKSIFSAIRIVCFKYFTTDKSNPHKHMFLMAAIAIVICLTLFSSCSSNKVTSVELATTDTTVVAWQDALIRGPIDPNLEGNKDNSNLGAIGQFQVGVFNSLNVERSLVQFDIPTGYNSSNITSAIMRLTSYNWIQKNYEDSFTVYAHQLLRSWKQGTSQVDEPTSAEKDGVTGVERFWGNQDGTEDWNRKLIGLDDVDAASAVSASITNPYGFIGVWEFDITELVKYWAENPKENFGLVLVSDIPSNDSYPHYPVFRSSEADQAEADKPKIFISVQ